MEKDPDEARLPTSVGAKGQKVILVEYPGLVENVEKMIKTFGGRENLSRTFTDPTRRLELRFRPEDPFSKPTCGDQTQVSVLLLKVQQIQRKRCKCGCKCKKHSQNEEIRTEIRTEILSAIDTSYTFNNLCDFQYLPTTSSKVALEESKNPAKPKSFIHEPIMEKVHFDKLVGAKWLADEAPLFLPPAAFSRMDQPQDYHFRKDTTGINSKNAAANAPLNIIGRTRQRRTLHAIFVNYDVDRVPEKASEVAINQLKVKFIENDQRERVIKSFEEKPVWTKSGLNCILDVSMERLKFILPTVAFYFTSGPWRNQWVKFGYDPRKDPGAAKYQTLDYRVRLVGGAKLKVRAKRSYANYLLPYKSMNWSKPKTSTIVREAFDDESQGVKETTASSKAESEKSRYIFEDGMIPPHRQMFYQYSDIRVEEAQKVFASSLKKNPTKCDEKYGWYKPGADAKVREILTNLITRALTKKDGVKDEESVDDFNEEEPDEDDETNEDMGDIVDEAMEVAAEDCEDFEIT